MRIRRAVFGILILGGISSFFAEQSQAQSPGRGPTPAPARGAAPAPAPRVQANLGQLMKGTLFPASNVIFAAQNENPADVPPAKDPSTSTNPLASSYGKWEAVENSALTIAEVANLLILPGRKCANGRDVPLKNADWPKFVQGLREAGTMAYKAAQSKNQDKIVDAAEGMTTACANCHDKYREKANLADRCQ